LAEIGAFKPAVFLNPPRIEKKGLFPKRVNLYNVLKLIHFYANAPLALQVM
jgi:hypothetical protein